MRKCNYVKDYIIDYVYGELERNKKKAMEEHLQQCSVCREEVIKMKKTLTVIEGKEIEAQDKEFWEGCWKNIRNNLEPLKIDEKEKVSFVEKIKSVFAVPSGIGFKIASVAAVLVIGIFIGRNFTFQNKYDRLYAALERLDNPVKIQTLENSYDEKLFRLASMNFIKKSEIVLLEFSGMAFEAGSETSKQELTFVKTLSNELIKELRIFKKVSEKMGNEKLKDLFNVMELILIEINNIDEDQEKRNIEGIKQSIDDSGVFLEIRNIITKS